MTGLYADPVIYDILYTPGTAAEVTAIECLEKRHSGHSLATNRVWFEPACGSGRYLRVAAGRGRRVAGFDRDEKQLGYARKRLPCPPAHLFLADMTDLREAVARAKLKVDELHFAFNPVNSLRHLTSDQAIDRHFRQMAAVMTPGALYVVGISLMNEHNLVPDEDVWVGVRGRCRVTQVVNYLPPEPGTARHRTEQVISHLTVTRPRGEQHFDSSYDLHCLDQQQWHNLVNRSPLTWVASYDGAGKPLGDRRLPYQLEVLRF